MATLSINELNEGPSGPFTNITEYLAKTPNEVLSLFVIVGLCNSKVTVKHDLAELTELRQKLVASGASAKKYLPLFKIGMDLCRGSYSIVSSRLAKLNPDTHETTFLLIKEKSFFVGKKDFSAHEKLVKYSYRKLLDKKKDGHSDDLANPLKEKKLISWIIQILEAALAANGPLCTELFTLVTKLVPDRYRPTLIYPFAAIHYWQEQDFINLSNVYRFDDSISKKADYPHLRSRFKTLMIFKWYVLRLAAIRQGNPGLYQCSERGPIYAMGDSHCLGFTGLNSGSLDQGGAVRSKLIMGLKIYHLKNSDHEKRQLLEAALKEFSQSKVILTIGEIDFRPDGGIMKYITKNNLRLTWREEVEKLFTIYVDFIESIRYFVEPVLVTVPAPMKDSDIMMSTPVGDQEILSNAIAYFNNLLENYTYSKNLKVLPCYQATLGTTGFSNSSHHFDSNHLHPTLYNELLQTI